MRETPNGKIINLHERILSRYDARQRDLIESVMKDFPTLTLIKAIEILNAFGL
jgi:hypothetical protein